MDEFDDNPVTDLVAGMEQADQVLTACLEAYTSRIRDFPAWGTADMMNAGSHSIFFLREAIALTLFSVRCLRGKCQDYHRGEKW